MKTNIKFELEIMDKGSVEHHISGCEGKHKQQAVYSTYQKALTQICFGCKKIRTSMEIDDIDELEVEE